VTGWGTIVVAVDLPTGASTHGAGEGGLAEENPNRWTHTETTVPDQWGRKGTGAH
jgi:hypothetical protein